MKILVRFLCIPCLFVFLATSQTQPAQALSQSQDKAPQFDFEQYQFGLLWRGPNATSEVTPETTKIQEGHMANIKRMGLLGKLFAAGPMGDNGKLRGIFIFKAASIEEAKALAAEDPAIKSGRLVLELVNWWGPKGIGTNLQEQVKKGIEPKYTMTQYYLALLSKGEKAADGKSPEEQKLQLEHLRHIRQQLDAKTFLAAGPFNGKSNVLGIFVIAAQTPEEAKAIAEADPKVKAGHLSVELHPWWVAKEVWP